MFQFLISKVKLVEFKGRQLVFVSKSRYPLRRTHPIRVQLQERQQAKTLDVYVESSRQIKEGFVYVGKVRGLEPAPRPLRGDPQRRNRRRAVGLEFRGEGCSGRTVNLSQDGFQAEVKGLPEVGSQVRLQFEVGRADWKGGTVPLLAQVRWVRHSHGIGGIVGFQVDPEQSENRQSMELLLALANNRPTSALPVPEDSRPKPEHVIEPRSEKPTESRRHRLSARLRGFSWDGPEGSLLLRFKDGRGKVRRLLFPHCRRLRLADCRANLLIKEMAEFQPCPVEDGVSHLEDLTSALYRLEDQHGCLVMEIVSQPFKILKNELEKRNVVSFRRKSKPLAAGF